MRWAGQASGPDWQDLAAAIRSLEKVHKCSVYLLVLSDGRDVSPGVRCVLAAARGVLEDPCSSDGPGVSWNFPSRSHRTFEGSVYKAIIELDRKCSAEWWRQDELPWGPD
jgi:hypothetical protein